MWENNCFNTKPTKRLLSLEEVAGLLEQLESDKYDVTSYINRMIHEKELSIVEVNERRNKLIDVSVTDSLQQKVLSKLPRIKKR